jgi:SNF family Na+-dependent transporter
MIKSKSSKRKLVKNNNINIYDDDKQHINIISTIVNIFIIYYLINLEHNHCNCIRDWRHNYIKYTAIFSLFIDLLLLLNTEINNISGILILLQIIYVYAFYTYIRDLDNTKCECAVVKQEKLHNFLNVWRYLIVILPIALLLILAIYFLYKYYKK